MGVRILRLSLIHLLISGSYSSLSIAVSGAKIHIRSSNAFIYRYLRTIMKCDRLHKGTSLRKDN